MKIIENVPVWGSPVDEGALKQIKTIASDSAEHVALMADHHVGYSMPIGGVAAYREYLSPSGVGYDIACGNKAVLTDMDGVELRKNIHRVMDDIADKISFGVGRKNKESVEHELFEDDAWSMDPIRQNKAKFESQLGTVGSGNHYVDLFTDELDRVWVGVHFGSRGLGHTIATHFIKQGGGTDGMWVPATLIHEKSDLGEQYLKLLELAGRYAYAGRDWVCGKVCRILKTKIVEEVHNHHNFAWRENHGGVDYWVIRKGATPAFPGQKGFVGGSMGDDSVILEGVDSEESKLALYSTVHGAGRALSRTQAAGKAKRGGRRTGGMITERMMEAWVKEKGVVLRGGGTDEAPHCYKRLPEVLEHHAPTIKILHRLKPVGVAMAGGDTRDPYKD